MCQTPHQYKEPYLLLLFSSNAETEVSSVTFFSHNVLYSKRETRKSSVFGDNSSHGYSLLNHLIKRTLMFSNKAILPPEGNWHLFLPSLESFIKEYAYHSPFSTFWLSFSPNPSHEPCFPIQSSTPGCFPSIPPVLSLHFAMCHFLMQKTHSFPTSPNLILYFPCETGLQQP